VAAEPPAAPRRVPPEAYARFCKGVALKLQEKHAEAIEALQQALQLDPRSPSILFEIGHCYYSLTKNAEALDYLTRSLALDPDNGLAHEILAFTHFAMGNREKWLAALEAAAHAARPPRNHHSLVKRIAWVYRRQGDHPNAIKWYRYLAQCGYADAADYLALGALQLKETLYADALESFRNVVRHAQTGKPTSPEIALAYAQLSEKDRDAAIRHLEAAAQNPDAATAEVLAMAYQAAGRRDDMLRALERAAAATSERADQQKLFLAEYFEQELEEIPQAIAWRTRYIESRESPSASDFVRLAILHVKHQQMPLAAEVYRKALAIAPERRELLPRIAACHAALYHWDRAAAALEEFLKDKALTPSDAYPVYQLSQVLKQAGKPDAAAARAQQAFDLLTRGLGTQDPKLSDVQIHILLAELSYSENKPEEALGHLVRAQELDPDDPKKLLLVAEGHQRVQQWPEAAATYRKYLEKDSASPAAAQALLQLAQCLEIGEDRDGAAATRAKADQLLLGLLRKAEKDEAKAELRESLGKLEYRRSQPQAAIDHFVEALRCDPKNSRFHLYLAECYQLLGDWTRTAAHYHSYVESLGPSPDPEDAIDLFRLGLAQVRAGDTEPGQRNQQRAITLLTDTLATLEREQRGTPAFKAELCRDLATPYSSLKQYPKAIEAMTRAVQLAPADKRSDYRLLLASLYDDMKRYAESEKILLDVYREDPDNPMVLNHLGYFYAERGRNLDQAVQLVKRALHYEPLSGAYIDSLGWAYFKQGKHQEALQLLLRAAGYWENAEILDHVGDAYHQLGQADKALEAWRKALRLDPDIEGVREKLQQAPPPDAPPAPAPNPPPGAP
jgi:tetratricopeptide (TPR) repeat protein